MNIEGWWGKPNKTIEEVTRAKEERDPCAIGSLVAAYGSAAEAAKEVHGVNIDDPYNVQAKIREYTQAGKSTEAGQLSNLFRKHTGQ